MRKILRKWSITAENTYDWLFFIAILHDDEDYKAKWKQLDTQLHLTLLSYYAFVA